VADHDVPTAVTLPCQLKAKEQAYVLTIGEYGVVLGQHPGCQPGVTRSPPDDSVQAPRRGIGSDGSQIDYVSV
jgi:hypothetical protein